MKTSKLFQVVATAGLAGALAFGLLGCSSNGNESSTVEGLTGGVAATVNGTEIQEDTVTTYIQNFRESAGYTDEESWGSWMAEQGMDPSTVREQVIDYYVGQELIRQAAKENNVSVETSEVDEVVNEMKANYEDDEAWQNALSQAGTDEETYRSSVEIGLLEQKLSETVAKAEEPSEEDMLQYAQMYATAYDGAKRSSHILFNAGDEATAQEVLDRINAGELDFADAAREYSQDEASAENGGDVGWDKLSSFVTEYTDALNGLEKDQVSGLVTSDYGIHIIKCTDVFTAPEEVTSTDQLPSEFVDTIRTTVENSNKSQAFSDWYTSYEESADIQINEMPENVPYNLDMSKYETADESSSTDSSSAATDAVSSSSADASASESTASSSSAESTESASESTASTDEGAASASEGSSSSQPAETTAN